MKKEKGKKGRPRRDAKKRFDAEPVEPGSLREMNRRFAQWMRIKNYSERTVEIRDHHLRYFILWCEEREIGEPREITKPILDRYQRYLYYYRKSCGEPLSAGTQSARLVSLKALFRWMMKENLLLSNPASELDGPRLPYTLPRNVLSVEEVETLLSQPDIDDPPGIRDRAILELFYSTGIRRIEMIHLKVEDVDWSRETLFIKEGKGKKDRVIPVGARALLWVRKYLDDIRPFFYPDEKEKTLCITEEGKPIEDRKLTALVKKYLLRAGIEKTGACHILRHTMATLMLENGADIRYIQEMLGHAKLSTTEVYTKVSIAKLKEVHKATHPAKIKPLKKG